MKNELFSIGPFTVYGYGLMIAIGILAAYISCEKRAPKYKLDPEEIFNILIFGVVGGFLGSKILYWLTRIKDVIADPSIMLDLANGWVVYGGIIGGILSAMLYCKIKKLPFLKYFDLAMPAVALAQGFGRIGCFLAGCCYGMETDCAIGIAFTESAFAPNGVKLLPTQLISSALDFLNFAVLIWLRKRKNGDGQVAGCYLIFYSIGRFILEFFRGDLIRGTVGTLTTSQFISIFTLFAGVIIVWVRKGKFLPDMELPVKEKEQ